MNQYETVFILTPVLSDDQMKETVAKFKNLLKSPGLLVQNFSTLIGEKILEFSDRFLHLFIRQNGSQNENGFVSIHCVKN